VADDRSDVAVRTVIVRHVGRLREGYGGKVSVVVHQGEAYFVIDNRQRIIEWSYAASVMVGILDSILKYSTHIPSLWYASITNKHYSKSSG
jgi:hypothetical protein